MVFKLHSVEPPPAQAPSFHVLHPEGIWDCSGCASLVTVAWSDGLWERQAREGSSNSWARVTSKGLVSLNSSFTLLFLSQRDQKCI